MCLGVMRSYKRLITLGILLWLQVLLTYVQQIGILGDVNGVNLPKDFKTAAGVFRRMYSPIGGTHCLYRPGSILWPGT